MKKIVAINASPRKGWNTDIIVTEAAKGAESAGAHIEKRDLYKRSGRGTGHPEGDCDEGIVTREEIFVTTKMWTDDFDRLVNATSIVPALLQNETHPYHQSVEMKEHLQRYGTVMESWFPLGGRGNTQTLFNDETISGIAQAHGKTSAQVILRWHLQAVLSGMGWRFRQKTNKINRLHFTGM